MGNCKKFMMVTVPKGEEKKLDLGVAYRELQSDG